MTFRHPGLAEVLKRDPRYAYEAYEFLIAALYHTQRRLGKAPPPEHAAPSPEHHVTGRQLLEGVRDLAVREFGLLARTVFRRWGINTTDDIGHMVFNLVDANLMSKTAEDTPEDFHAVFDWDAALADGFDFKTDGAE
jgi:uncharacterized repeat protein (TIGR04138 family)